tara:strand:- start:736 stop:2043 length:1308 start_codon:yes stop_codon:yes gene_type:complete
MLVTMVLAEPEIHFQNEEIQVGETILAEISLVGGFINEIKNDDLIFLEGRKKVFFESKIAFYNGTHYLSIYTTRPGNFSIKIEDLLYREGGGLVSTSLEKDFFVETKLIEYQEEVNESGNIILVNKTKTEILQIKPGLIVPVDESKIKLINIGDSNISVKFQEIMESQEIVLEPGEEKEILISRNSSFELLNIESYKNFQIHIISIIKTISTNPPWFPSLNESLDLKTNPKSLIVNLISGEEKEEVIELFNFADENITNIRFNINSIPLKDLENLEILNARDIINLTLNFDSRVEGLIEDNLQINYTQGGKEYSFLIPIKIYTLPEGSTEENFTEEKETCEDLGGAICKEKCNGTYKFTKGREFCCVGICEKGTIKEDDSSILWIIGVLIILFLGIIGYVIYKKSKKVGPKKPEEKLAETTKKYSKRMSGSLQRT